MHPQNNDSKVTYYTVQQCIKSLIMYDTKIRTKNSRRRQDLFPREWSDREGEKGGIGSVHGKGEFAMF